MSRSRDPPAVQLLSGRFVLFFKKNAQLYFQLVRGNQRQARGGGKNTDQLNCIRAKQNEEEETKKTKKRRRVQSFRGGL